MTYIDPRAKALRHLDRIVGWQQGEKPAPVTVEFDLSNRCHLACESCHFAHTHVRGPWAMKPRLLPLAYDSGGDLADVDLVCDSLRDMAKAGVQAVIWSGGGEPTTHPAWLACVAAAHANGLQQGMYTSGGLLTQQSASKLAALASWVVVSLDAPDAATYAAEKGVPAARFEAACNGIRWLSGQRAVIGVSYLLHEHNWFRIAEMVDGARALGASYSTFRPAILTAPDRPNVCTDDRAWITDALPVLDQWSLEPDVEVEPARFAAYRDWTSHGYTACQGIRLNTTITPDGRVWVCPQRRGCAGSCLGDLRTESFGALWARHPGSFTVDAGCRVMCRLHPVNQTLDAIGSPRPHEAFV